MIADSHMHTYLCQHASGMPAEYLAAAEKRLIPAICFADHVPTPDGYDKDSRMTREEYPKYRQMISALQPGNTTRVLFGIEADYYEGCESYLGKWLREQPFDLVIGSVHFIDDWGFDNPRNVERWKTTDVTVTWRKYFALLGRLADTRLFDVVGHLDVAKRFGYRPPDKIVAELAAPALDSIARSGMAIEINTSGLRRPVREIYPSPSLLQMARERKIPIVFGSDAHRPEEVGWEFDKALALARQCGYSETLLFKERRPAAIALPRA